MAAKRFCLNFRRTRKINNCEKQIENLSIFQKYKIMEISKILFVNNLCTNLVWRQVRAQFLQFHIPTNINDIWTQLQTPPKSMPLASRNCNQQRKRNRHSMKYRCSKTPPLQAQLRSRDRIKSIMPLRSEFYFVLLTLCHTHISLSLPLSSANQQTVKASKFKCGEI